MRCGFWPLIHSYEMRVHRKAFPAIKLLAHPRGLSLSRICPILWQFVCTSPLAVITVVGLLDVVTVSHSAEFKPFLLIMCIDAPESTTNSLSSGLIADGASTHQFSEGETNAVLCFSFNFKLFLASLHAASRAHRSCRSSNFGVLGLRWWGSPGQIIPSDGFWSRVLAWRTTAFSESNTSDWFQYVWALPQNRWRLRRLHILTYGTQLSCNFQHSHCTSVTILFKPFARPLINLAMRIRALFPKSASILQLVEQVILEDATFHRMEWCKFLWGNPCTAVETFFHLGFCLTFHGIRPTFFVQTWLKQYCRGAFLYSAHCSFRNPISLRSVWGRRAMIPGEIFTSFAEFQGIVSVNDFWFPLGFQELLQASLGFLWSFCFARICLDPLSG